MANRLYNKQVTPKGYKMGGRVKKMGGGMMKRNPMMKGGRVKKMGGGSMMKKREAMKKGSIPPQLKNFVMAKKKKAKMKKKKA